MIRLPTDISSPIFSLELSRIHSWWCQSCPSCMNTSYDLSLSLCGSLSFSPSFSLSPSPSQSYTMIQVSHGQSALRDDPPTLHTHIAPITVGYSPFLFRKHLKLTLVTSFLADRWIRIFSLGLFLHRSGKCPICSNCIRLIQMASDIQAFMFLSSGGWIPTVSMAPFPPLPWRIRSSMHCNLLFLSLTFWWIAALTMMQISLWQSDLWDNSWGNLGFDDFEEIVKENIFFCVFQWMMVCIQATWFKSPQRDIVAIDRKYDQFELAVRTICFSITWW
jgi:hypothetical protein